jgi:hypothetical protein
MLEAALGNLTGGLEDAGANGKIEGTALLGEGGRSQVYGDAGGGETKSLVSEGGPDAFLALSGGGVGESDHVKAREALAEVDLDFNRKGLDTVGGCREAG